MRDELVGRITDVVHGLWPLATLKVFGSFAAGICLPTSDIDIVILGEWEVLPLKTLAKSLEDAGIPSKLQVLEKTRVPLIKFRDSVTSVDVDISFNVEVSFVPSLPSLALSFV